MTEIILCRITAYGTALRCIWTGHTLAFVKDNALYVGRCASTCFFSLLHTCSVHAMSASGSGVVRGDQVKA